MHRQIIVLGLLLAPVASFIATSRPFARPFVSLSAVISVDTSLPLGIVLEDADMEKNGRTNGVFVSEAGGDSDCGNAGVAPGYRVSSVNGVDTRFSDYDAVVELLTSNPDSVKVEFEEKFADGHPVTINVDGHGPLSAAVGDNLRQVLLDNKVNLYSSLKAKMGNCGGGGQCGLCKVAISEDDGVWPERTDHEGQKLKKYGADTRLACFTFVEGDCTVKLP
mmetsp:Transcript_19507/g.40694  ORF Transcript_19507/g.40694 Transcript_19507/m.40694 type:complete len:221 (+) Transcript_19507:162-824(+)